MSALSDSLWIANLAISVPLFIIGGFSCFWTTYAWHSPERYEQSTFVKTRNTTAFSFSVIVPVRDELYSVMAATIGCLLAQTHDRVQAVLSVGYDDPQTLANAWRLVDEDPTGRLTVSISYSDVHNKPTQLNSALRDCTGDIIGILDAESLSAPDLLTQVDAAFQDAGVEVVQGAIILTNYRSSWVAMRCGLEYYAHHRSKMHYSAARGAILMGGNTIFFKRELLEQLDGWDETNLTEDAEISLRLAKVGHHVTVAYDPHLVSREEAPTTVKAWIKQRTRWNLGFLQTIEKGVWRELPDARQRRLALWHLLQPSVMSFTGLVMPLSIASYFLSRPPLAVAMFTWLPTVPTIFTIIVECVMLKMSTGEHDLPAARVRDYFKVVVSAPAYQLMLAIASLRAVVKYVRGDVRWEKTRHEGLHLPEPALTRV